MCHYALPMGLTLLLLALSGASEPTCSERGYTLCNDVCCGRNSTTGEAACCLEASAVCCNKPSLAEQGNRFFCCPQTLPICDFDAGTCRASEATLLDGNQEEEQLHDIYRAMTRKPREEYRGRSTADSSLVLNAHLERNVMRHGYLADRKLRSCTDFSLRKLHELQRRLMQLRSPLFNEHYAAVHDNRYIVYAMADELEAVWHEDLQMVSDHPHLEAVLRNSQCYEVVMSYVHHLQHTQQKAFLANVPAMPFLPVNDHVPDLNLSTGSNSVLEHVRQRVIQQVGCGACHISNRSVLSINATHCPATEATLCMELGRLHCTNSTGDNMAQCCAGLICQNVYIPASEMAFSMSTTRCAVDPELKEVLESRRNVSILNRNPENVAGMRERVRATLPPVLPSSWRANGTYYNITGPYPQKPAGYVNFLYQEFGIGNQSSMRVDFGPVCPFKQLWKTGLSSNYVPCSVIYRNNTVSYVYHGIRSCIYCSEDAISPWHRDFICRAGSDLSSNISIAVSGNRTISVDLWRFEWWTTVFLVLRNYRNWYFQTGTNIPVRVSEDLDTGYTDFDYFQPVPSPGVSDSEIMAGVPDVNVSYIAGLHATRPCPGEDERNFVKPGDVPECTFVQAIPPRRTWPQRDWPPL